MALFSKYEVMLAPMAGITNLAFRLICARHGADLTFSEMVSAMGLEYSSEKTNRLIDSCDSEKILSVQLFGHIPSVIAKQANMIEKELGCKLSHIDINMGCPAKKIVKKGDGAALMNSPKLACEIVSSVRQSVSCPVTVKTRRGFSNDDETITTFATELEKAGASAICVHGRFAMQYYKGSCDLNSIKSVKRALTIPVIGNGDVFTKEDYVKMKEETSCDAVLIGRGATKHPFIFSEIKEMLNGKCITTFSVNDKMNIAIEHAKLIEKLKVSHKNITFLQFRKQAMNYVEGLNGAKVARKEICVANCLRDFVDIFEGMKDKG